mgnify:CR=1 FL=1
MEKELEKEQKKALRDEVLNSEEFHQKLSSLVEDLEKTYTEFHYHLHKFFSKKQLASIRRVRRMSRTLELKLKEIRKMTKGL